VGVPVHIGNDIASRFRLEVRATAEFPTEVREDAANRNEERLRDLMVLYQRADVSAVEELIGRVSPLLLRYFSSANVTRGDAEDLLQDCWLRIHRSRHTYRASEPVLPWIFAIARHTRLDGYRRQQRLRSREVLVATTPEQTSSGRPTESQTGGGVLELLNRLPESQREVIVMLKVLGMSVEEVARATSSTAGAIKQKAHRAYVGLRRMLEGGK
jgi:RNA polymerase sigma-70 factor (ECF subfamily)